MGVLTSFTLLEPEFAKLKPEELTGGPVEFVLFENGQPEDFGLPNGYKTRRCGIDKMWEEWSDVLRAYGWHEVRDCLFSFPREVDNPWGFWLRSLPVSESDEPGLEDDVKYIKAWMQDFDPKAAAKASLDAEVTDYYGQPMDEILVEYLTRSSAKLSRSA